jgi:hypothetical protein
MVKERRRRDEELTKNEMERDIVASRRKCHDIILDINQYR